MSTICAVDDAKCSSRAGAIPARRGPAVGLKGLFRQVIAWIAEREDKRLSRLALAELTDDQLADIGVTPLEARIEAARPFWN